MAGSALPNIDYYFRKERLSDDCGERVHGADELTCPIHSRLRKSPKIAP